MNRSAPAAVSAAAPAPVTLTPGFFARRNWSDWLFAALALAGGLFAFMRYQEAMSGYEQIILLCCIPVAIGLGWFWRPLRILMAAVTLFTLLAIWSYGGDLRRGDSVFWLKYFLSSQSAILWMCLLFFMSTLFYWIGLLTRGAAAAWEGIGSKLAWVAVAAALVGTFVRWYESYQMGPGVGHIPVSNLYEVFVLFCWLTALFYLYYEARYQTRALGAFVLLAVSAAVGFLLWYALVRGAQEIQPLVPALQSWWMKLHVPANFIGYGTFALAAMAGSAIAKGEPFKTGVTATRIAIGAFI
ncbi:MAG: cytochrome c biogenesis protein CcsA, partial [Burkholderiaceae bacterium]|nr:cytochrome c biogenesis protein CcsA [Burkholderiaceae bacterium]